MNPCDFSNAKELFHELLNFNKTDLSDEEREKFITLLSKLFLKFFVEATSEYRKKFTQLILKELNPIENLSDPLINLFARTQLIFEIIKAIKEITTIAEAEKKPLLNQIDLMFSKHSECIKQSQILSELNGQIQKLDSELQKIKDEINNRSRYFENIKKDLEQYKEANRVLSDENIRKNINELDIAVNRYIQKNQKINNELKIKENSK